MRQNGRKTVNKKMVFPNNEAVILANGAFPTKESLINKLKEAKYLICCDGAANKLSEIGVKPHAIIGDLDSLNHNLKEKYKDIIHHISEQNSNDLSKTVNWAVNKGFEQLTIMGATGKREDHEIANIFLLLRYVKKVKIRMISDYGVFTPIKSDTIFKSYPEQQVSIFTPDSSIKISTRNLQYPLENQNLPELWNGTLNQSLTNNFEIKLLTKGEILVYQAHGKNRAW